MTGNRNLTEAQRWLTQALHDRDAARLNRTHDFHEHACFLAQQSAEKALKSFLYARGQGPRKAQLLGNVLAAWRARGAPAHPAAGRDSRCARNCGRSGTSSE